MDWVGIGFWLPIARMRRVLGPRGLIGPGKSVSIIGMSDVKKSDVDEQVILQKLDRELDSMIDKLAGTEMDYDPAIENASVEATLHADSDDE
jgi:hypothetical protein